MRARILGRLLLCGALALAVAVVASAHAQTLLRTLDSPNPYSWGQFGWSVAAGDVNGDGTDDIAVGAPGEYVGGDAWGRAYVFSGGGGSLLLTVESPNPNVGADFGNSLAVGDVNGDGKGDITVGAGGERVGGNAYQGRAYVFSGADGSLLFTLDSPNPQEGAGFGYSVAVGDVNGDGKDDIAVGAAGEIVDGNSQGQAYVFSGADGSLLFTLNTPNPQGVADFGISVAVGDVNGDGKADIAVGADGAEVSGNADQGRAYVFSGADGSVLFTLDSPNPQAGAEFGISGAVGDVNGDGKGDIAVGARWGGSAGQGRIHVFSGADGSLLFTLDSPNPQTGSWFGYRAAMGDVNGDGKGDIAVGATGEDVGGNADQGRAYVFSGADGSQLSTLDSPNPQAGASFGASPAVGDLNGDGKADIVVGAAGEDVGGNTAQGRAYVFSGAGVARGVSELPNLGGGPPDIGGSSGVTAGQAAGVAGLAAAAGLSLVGAALYGKRRWLR
jgi:hypothetical protein